MPAPPPCGGKVKRQLHCELEDLVAFQSLRLGDLDRQAALDGLAHIGEQFLMRFALRHAAGNGRHFRPEPAFLGAVNDYF